MSLRSIFFATGLLFYNTLNIEYLFAQLFDFVP